MSDKEKIFELLIELRKLKYKMYRTVLDTKKSDDGLYAVTQEIDQACILLAKLRDTL